MSKQPLVNTIRLPARRSAATRRASAVCPRILRDARAVTCFIHVGAELIREERARASGATCHAERSEASRRSRDGGDRNEILRFAQDDMTSRPTRRGRACCPALLSMSRGGCYESIGWMLRERMGGQTDVARRM